MEQGQRQRQGFALDIYGWMLVVLAAIFSVAVLVTSDFDPAMPSLTGASPVVKTDSPSAFVTSEGAVADSVQAGSDPRETFAKVSTPATAR